MRPRPLETENRILRTVGADQLRVSLGTAVKEMIDTPTLGTLIGNKFEQIFADNEALNEVNQYLQEEQEELLSDLDSQSGPEARKRIRERLAELYDDKGHLIGDPQTEIAVDIGVYKTPEQLTEKYGSEVLKFTEAMSEEEAQLLYKNKQEDIIRNSIIDAGPKGFVAGAAKFGGGILAMATDPVEVATMFIPVVSQAKTASYVARFGRVGGRAVTGAIEGGVGSLLTEPLYYGLSKDQQLDYSMQEALFNVGAGIFLGGGIGTIAGILSRKSFDGPAVEEMGWPGKLFDDDMKPLDLSQYRIDGEKPLDLSQYRVIDDAEIAANSNKASKQTLDMSDVTGGRVTYELAVRQFATDQNVRVDLIAPKAVKRPKTLSEFIRSRGGIVENDPVFMDQLKDLDLKGRNPTKKNKSNAAGGVAKKTSDKDVAQMTELAYDAGYLDSRNADELISRLRNEADGTFSFSRNDFDKAELWRTHYDAKLDIEAEQALRKDIRAELEQYGKKDLTEDEVALISERMAATGEDAVDAAAIVSIKVENIRAAMLARNATDPVNDALADFEASSRAELESNEVEFDEALQLEDAMVRQMRDSGELSPEQIAEIDELDAIDAHAEAHRELTEVAMTCVART